MYQDLLRASLGQYNSVCFVSYIISVVNVLHLKNPTLFDETHCSGNTKEANCNDSNKLFYT